MPTLPPVLISLGLLVLSNIFMTFAWYAHLRDLIHKPWIIAAIISWGIAFFEYMLQVLTFPPLFNSRVQSIQPIK